MIDEENISSWAFFNYQSYQGLTPTEYSIITRLYSLYLKKLADKYQFKIMEDLKPPISFFLKGDHNMMEYFPEYIENIMGILSDLFNGFMKEYGLIFSCITADRDVDLHDHINKYNPELKEFKQVMEKVEELEEQIKYFDYAEIYVYIDPNYSFKKDCFLMKHSLSKLEELEDYFNRPHFFTMFEGPINGQTDDGDEYHICLLGSDGESYSGIDCFNPNFIDAKMEFKSLAGF